MSIRAVDKSAATPYRKVLHCLFYSFFSSVSRVVYQNCYPFWVLFLILASLVFRFVGDFESSKWVTFYTNCYLFL